MPFRLLACLTLALALAGPVAGQVSPLQAGPIWNNDDARGKCPKVCGGRGLGWTGDWRTTGFNRSECDCAAGATAGPAPTGTSSCSVGAIGRCDGCSIACRSGGHAQCRAGQLYSTSSPDCAFVARCTCE